ncbi:ribonuclease H-like domain-containing protein [Rhexocercosporidium sp. MPI-PUGE-AT-0058]|nr:ribonuclease H-like domain-containing protein [Rhexocercosporidium sp. MPI-PUGE-AT-0058]
MEVDQAHFRRQLLPILKNIANATFVTFDLEMSGISTRPKYSAGDRSHDVGKPTLQQQYDDMRSAAETFQVLQFGITCVEEDREKDFYLARPYNFNLNPLSADGVDLRLDRTFTFSTSACDFLNKNGFDFGKVFREGVPYLSRDEEEERRAEHSQRANKNASIPDIVIGPEDLPTLEFSRLARKTIKDWFNDPTPDMSFVNIGSDAGALNAYQRRLVHQLVRNEFPTLRTFPRNDGYFMQVEHLDVKKEEEFQKRKDTRFNSLIAKQKGLRWIFEALSGGELSDIDPEWFYNPSAEDSQEQWLKVQREFTQITQALRRKKHIIVGHNLFADLAFLFRTFIGHLPVNVKHFQEDIHALFPYVIDTKYVATYGNDAMNPRSNLKELLAPFRKIHVPLILLHESHTSYGAEFGKEHEAGFDSWMTAELFVKLAASKCLEANVELESLSSSDSSGGGAHLYDSDRESSIDSTPPSWHARKLNANTNPYAALSLDFAEEKDRNSTGSKQWLPAFNNKFWDIYVNKLRVNASETGFCDLAEREDDERLNGLRVRVRVRQAL